MLLLRESDNIYFDIISLLAANNHSNIISSILKKLANQLNVIFKNKQGMIVFLVNVNNFFKHIYVNLDSFQDYTKSVWQVFLNIWINADGAYMK